MYKKTRHLFEVLPTPFEDNLMGFLVFNLQWIMISIEHMFVYVNNFFERTFVYLWKFSIVIILPAIMYHILYF